MHDFIAIGDIVTDAFIKIEDASVHCDIDNENCKICMDFGAKIPYEEVIEVKGVGNAPNAAVSAATLGLKSALVSNLGDDYQGKEAIEALKKRNVDTAFISAQSGRKTNYSYVIWFHEDRTILRKHEDFDYELPDLGNPKWIYFSSISIKADSFRQSLIEYLEKNSDIKLAFQPGTNEIKLGSDKLKSIYERAEIFFCNKEEAAKILGTEDLNIEKLLEGIHNLGPKTAVITDGPKGAYAYDGKEQIFCPVYPQKPAKERTGAGDAFSSTTTVALVLGKDIKEALLWGAINSMSVVQVVGGQAGLLTRDKLEEYLKGAPEDFKVKKL